MDRFLQDLRYGLRLLIRSPGFALIAITALAIGIGANTAIFSVVNGVLLKALPYDNPDELTMVWLDNRRQSIHEDITSWPNYIDWRDQNTTFQAMAGYRPGRRNLTGQGEPEELVSCGVTENFFSLMRVSAVQGRTFTPEETQPGKDSVVVLSFGLWQRRFGGDPEILSKTIQLNGTPLQVVGIAPRGFDFPSKVDVWTPLAPDDRTKAARGSFWLPVVGRMKSGITRERAQADMDIIGRRLEDQFPNINKGYGVNVVPLYHHTVGDIKLALWLLLGAVGLVLLIACANVANLMLARGTARHREIAVRAAMGAGRGRIIAQLLTESIILALVASLLGVLLAVWGINLLTKIAPANLPRITDVQIDGRVLLFTVVVGLATSVIFGLLPALQASWLDLNHALKEGGRSETGGRRAKLLRSAFVVIEIALAIVLLVSAGLLIRSFSRLKRVDPGFRTDHVLTAQLALPRTKYRDGAQVHQAYQQLIDRLRALPDVQGVSATTQILMPKITSSSSFTIEGRPNEPDEQRQELPMDAIFPDYFSVMGIQLLKGRSFTEQDSRESLPVAIINDAMVRRYFPNDDPLGKRFTFGDGRPQSNWMTIVGVVKDTKRQGLSSPVRMESFLPHAQNPSSQMEIVIHTKNDPSSLSKAFRDVVRQFDPDLPVRKIQTMEDIFATSIAEQRLNTLLFGLFGGIALVLAAIGIYGVMSYATNQRLHEMGIRIALGATRRNIVRLVVGQGMVLALAGVAIGLVGAFAAARVLRNLLFEIGTTDIVTFAITPVILIAVALLACYLPARRATKVDPISTLRYE